MAKPKDKIKEAVSSVLPITCIVSLLSVTITPMPVGTILLSVCGAVMLVIGMRLFSLGADISIMLMGEGIDTMLSTLKKRCLVVCITFVIGFIITVAGPDLTALAYQIPDIPDNTLIQTIAAGVGLFLVMALLRILSHWNLKYLPMLFYALVFVLTYFSVNTSMVVAFDSGGVTTGPITIPFLTALGTGIASVTQKHIEEEGFGIVALCNTGPILAILLLGILYGSQGVTYTPFEMTYAGTSKDVIRIFLTELPHYMWEVSKTLLPILCFFFLFQPIGSYFDRRAIIKTLIGTPCVLLGLILLPCGINVGFMPAGCFVGTQITVLSHNWILIPIGVLIDFFIVEAEPAVRMPTRQVEDTPSGTISTKAMLYSLSTGTGISLRATMLHILSCISIMVFLIPRCLIAVILSFFVPSVSTGIVFDSGDVANGPMTATFLLPFAMGAYEQLEGSVLLDAFGIMAMVAVTPLLTIQILGLVMTGHRKAAARELQEDSITEFEEVINERTES